MYTLRKIHWYVKVPVMKDGQFTTNDSTESLFLLYDELVKGLTEYS